MWTFKEFQEKAAQTADKRLYLSLEQQKECYKWYLKGARKLMDKVLCEVEHYCGLIGFCDKCCPKSPMYDVDAELDEMEKQYAKTEEN